MELVVRINGIHCAGCVSRIESAMNGLGVDKFDLDLYTKIAKIYYDRADELIDNDLILSSIDSLGYETTLLAEIEA